MILEWLYNDLWALLFGNNIPYAIEWFFQLLFPVLLLLLIISLVAIPLMIAVRMIGGK